LHAARRPHARDDEGLLVLILGLLAFGMLIGWLAGLILGQGTKPSGRALIAGLAGSFIGGLLVSLLSGDGLKLKPSGLIGSLLGAIIVLAVWAAIDRKAHPVKQPHHRSGDPRKN
jgi:uncharacterized membrane protein YeaQ/YmgE (transglycosylase-associated protein family)